MRWLKPPRPNGQVESVGAWGCLGVHSSSGTLAALSTAEPLVTDEPDSGRGGGPLSLDPGAVLHTRVTYSEVKAPPPPWQQPCGPLTSQKGVKSKQGVAITTQPSSFRSSALTPAGLAWLIFSVVPLAGEHVSASQPGSPPPTWPDRAHSFSWATMELQGETEILGVSYSPPGLRCVINGFGRTLGTLFWEQAVPERGRTPLVRSLLLTHS